MKRLIDQMPGLRPVAHIGMLLVLLSLGMLGTPVARADTLLMASTNLVTGSSTATYSFTAPTAGTVTARIASVPWPDALSALSFSATSASSTLSSWSAASPSMAPQVETFQVGAGTYFAHVMATAGGSLDLGLYSLMLTFSPSAVPLPAAAWMLLIGIFVFVGLRHTLGDRASRSLEPQPL